MFIIADADSQVIISYDTETTSFNSMKPDPVLYQYVVNDRVVPQSLIYMTREEAEEELRLQAAGDSSFLRNPSKTVIELPKLPATNFKLR